MTPTEKQVAFSQLVPGAIFLDSSDLDHLNAYLLAKNILLADETITSCEVPGGGNMNYVLRLCTNVRSFILKQSRPWVEKYPTIEAPIERSHIEAEFYTNLSSNQFLTLSSPEILFADPENYVIVMEDLGNVQDFGYLYAGERKISAEQLTFLATYLSELHQLSIPQFASNTMMRKLNHET